MKLKPFVKDIDAMLLVALLSRSFSVVLLSFTTVAFTSASVIPRVNAQRYVGPPVYSLSLNSPPESLLGWAHQEYKYARDIGAKDFVGSQKAYIRAAQLLDTILRKHPTFARTDEVLLLLGRCKAQIDGDGRTPEEANFIKQHAADYQYREGVGIVYNGTEFREIVARFPQSSVVDQAAYELASREGLECEGDWPCYLKRALDRFEPFIRRYAKSPLIGNAIQSINEDGFKDVDQVARDRIGGTISREYKTQLDRYNSLARSLPNRYWAQAGPPIAKAYERLQERQISKQIYTDLLTRIPNSPEAGDWRNRLDSLSKSSLDQLSHSQIVQNLYANDEAKMQDTVRFLVQKRDPSFISEIKVWLNRSQEHQSIDENTIRCDLLKWVFEVDRPYIYSKLEDWQGGGSCIWTFGDPSLPGRILDLANKGRPVNWPAASEALRRVSEETVIAHLSHRSREVRKAAVFIVMQKKYKKAVPQLWHFVETDVELHSEVESALSGVDPLSGVAYEVLWLFRKPNPLAKSNTPNSVSGKKMYDEMRIRRLQYYARFNPPLDVQNQELSKQKILGWWLPNRSNILNRIEGLPPNIRRELEAIRHP